MLRVLCLPGFGQNAITFHRKFAAVQKHCKNQVDFFILDPPHILPSAIDPSDSNVSLNASSFQILSPDTPSDETTPRAWWTANNDRTVYEGMDTTIPYVRDFLKAESDKGKPFDGVLGFSQGAGMAGVLVALLEGQTYAHPQFLVDGKLPHPPFRFGIFISGFKAIDPAMVDVFYLNPAHELPAPQPTSPSDEPVPRTPYLLKTPTLHVLGRVDVIVGIKRSQMLIDTSLNPRVEWHESGHHIPSKLTWRNFFRDYMVSFDSSNPPGSPTHLDIPSPTPAMTTVTSAL